MNKELKDSVEFVTVSAAGVSVSSLTLDEQLKIFILVCTAIYAVMKIIKGYLDIQEKRKKLK